MTTSRARAWGRGRGQSRLRGWLTISAGLRARLLEYVTAYEQRDSLWPFTDAETRLFGWGALLFVSACFAFAVTQ